MKYGLNPDNNYGWRKLPLEWRDIYAAIGRECDFMRPMMDLLALVGLDALSLMGPFAESDAEGKPLLNGHRERLVIPVAFRVLLPYCANKYGRYAHRKEAPVVTPFMAAPRETVELLVWAEYPMPVAYDSSEAVARTILRAAEQVNPDWFTSHRVKPLYRAAWVGWGERAEPGRDRGDEHSNDLMFCLWNALARIRHAYNSPDWTINWHSGSEANYRPPYVPTPPPSEDAWFYASRYKAWQKKALGKMIGLADELMGRDGGKRGELAVVEGQGGEVSLA